MPNAECILRFTFCIMCSPAAACRRSSGAAGGFDVEDACDQRAGWSGDRASRLDDNRQAGGTYFAEQRLRISLRRRDVAAVVRDAQPAAEIQILEIDSEALDLRGQIDETRRRAAQRI